ARSDLGWDSLWVEAVVGAIVLYQKMRNDPEQYLHSRWSSQLVPPKGTWVSIARALQARFGVEDIASPESGNGGAVSTGVLKQHYKSYSQNQVRPKVLGRMPGSEVAVG
ncbi:MAG: hypothetical protein ACKPKO_20415, partial [Candidatus Fonsibacter sp.]